jgi:putative transcriptional regulator
MSEFESLAGKFLIAVPDLLDPNFHRSVVLMIHHDPTGASGLILNRASNTKIGDVFEDVTPLPTESHPIYVGGPVEGPVMAVHQCVSLGERDILSDVYFSMGRDNLLGIIAQTTRRFRLFCGYSGWGPSQLEREISAGGWLTATPTSELVFANEEALWRSICDQVGLDIIFAHRPEPHHATDPSLN